MFCNRIIPQQDAKGNHNDTIATKAIIRALIAIDCLSSAPGPQFLCWG